MNDVVVPPRRTFQESADALSSLRGMPEDDLDDDQTEALKFAQPIEGSTTGSYSRRRAEIFLRHLREDLRVR
jgi:hypothetical protein